jgi:hypothetical protein
MQRSPLDGDGVGVSSVLLYLSQSYSISLRSAPPIVPRHNMIQSSIGSGLLLQSEMDLPMHAGCTSECLKVSCLFQIIKYEHRQFRRLKDFSACGQCCLNAMESFSGCL